MALMDKIAFWKHKEEGLEKPPELGLGKDRELGLDLGEPDEPGLAPPGAPPEGMPEPGAPSGMQGLGQEPRMPAAPRPPGINAPTPSAFQQPVSNKDIEVLSAKLDSLKANLETINQRLENIERMAKG